MDGNVLECANNWYRSSYSGSSSCNNPPEPASGAYRVVREGNWYHDFGVCLLVASRYYGNPALQFGTLGFRCIAAPGR